MPPRTETVTFYDAADSLETMIESIKENSIYSSKLQPLSRLDIERGYTKQFKLTILIEEIHDEVKVMKGVSN